MRNVILLIVLFLSGCCVIMVPVPQPIIIDKQMIVEPNEIILFPNFPQAKIERDRF